MSRGLGRFQRDLLAELADYPWSGLPEIACRWTDNPCGIVARTEYEQLRKAMAKLRKAGLVTYRWVNPEGYRYREWALADTAKVSPTPTASAATPE
jgi:hypothetical protein